MAQQMATTGGTDDIFIQGQLRDNSTNSIFNFTVKCMENWAVTTADDKNFLKKMVKTEQRKGNKFIKYLPGKQWVVQNYPDTKKQEIAKLISSNLKKAGANITKNG